MTYVRAEVYRQFFLASAIDEGGDFSPGRFTRREDVQVPVKQQAG
jgi:hypothetical protein